MLQLLLPEAIGSAVSSSANTVEPQLQSRDGSKGAEGANLDPWDPRDPSPHEVYISP